MMEWKGKEGKQAWFSGRWSVLGHEVEGGTLYEIYRWDDRLGRRLHVRTEILLAVAVAVCERMEKELRGEARPMYARGERS